MKFRVFNDVLKWVDFVKELASNVQSKFLNFIEIFLLLRLRKEEIRWPSRVEIIEGISSFFLRVPSRVLIYGVETL